jgi:hypothetical protein
MGASWACHTIQLPTVASMSTRSTTHFFSGDDEKPVAIVYRHSDGFPETAGCDLLAFLDELKRNVPDNRLNDPWHLSARYVMFLGRLFNSYNFDRPGQPKHPLDFLDVCITDIDPGDIEFRYEVRCGKEPMVRCFQLLGDGKEKVVRIPKPKADRRRDFALTQRMPVFVE